MKKYLIITFVFLPFLSFGQLSSVEKKAIDNYSINICNCINNMMETLGTKANEIILIMANEGEEEANKVIVEYVQTASEEDTKKLLASFDQMSSPEFTKEIEKCDNKEGLSSDMIFSIDNEKGEYSEYFYYYLANTLECKVTNYLMLLGTEEDENEE